MNAAVAVARVTAAAMATVGLNEQGGPNCGQFVETVLKFCGLGKGYPWCAAFVSYIGTRALTPISGTSAWPLPKTAGCVVLGDFAKQHDLLRTKPAPGDVFLVYFPKLKRFAHTGFIVGNVQQLSDGRWKATTIEGNTSDNGSREGWGTLKRERTFGPNDRFIRWTDLLV